jgi:hypothetical protein
MANTIYSRIPKGSTKPFVIKALTNELTNLCRYIHKRMPKDDLSSLLDLWLEHDSLRENRFDHLFVEDDQDLDEIVDSVIDNTVGLPLIDPDLDVNTDGFGI